MRDLLIFAKHLFGAATKVWQVAQRRVVRFYCLEFRFRLRKLTPQCRAMVLHSRVECCMLMLHGGACRPPKS